MPSTPLLELVVRGTITFLALLLMIRLLGQREAGGLGVTDLLVLVLVADAASAGLRGEANSIADGLVLVATILLWSLLLDALGYRFPALARFLKGEPHKLIKDGRLDHRVARRELLTRDEVLSQLRLHGIEDIADVHLAYLEPNGMISILRRDGGEPDEPVEPPTT